MPVPRVSEMEVRDPKEQGQAHQWDPAWVLCTTQGSGRGLSHTGSRSPRALQHATPQRPAYSGGKLDTLSAGARLTFCLLGPRGPNAKMMELELQGAYYQDRHERGGEGSGLSLLQREGRRQAVRNALAWSPAPRGSPWPRGPSHGPSVEVPACSCVLAGQDPAAFLRSRQPWAALITRPLIRPQPSPHGPAWCSCWQTELETKRVSKSLGCLAKAGSRWALS